MSEKQTIDIAGIMDLLPHRYPLLLLDRVLEYVPGESAVGLKNVSMNEPHFQGHFPDFPVMPGVLIVEAMAQTAACLVMKTLGEESHGNIVYFMSIDNARFRKPVVPGDSMHIHVTKIQNRKNVWKFKGEAKINGKIHAEAVLTAMITEKNSEE